MTNAMRFVGVWESQSLESNYPEFRALTNLSLRVYSIEFRQPEPAIEWAKMQAEFVGKTQEGKEVMPYLCFPMRLHGTNQIAAGPFMEALGFHYIMTSTNLTLTGRESGMHFKATFKKVKDDAGTPRFIP